MALAAEELPPGFFESPAAARPGPSERPPGRRAKAPGPPSAAPAANRRGAADLRSALLGSGASVEEMPEALRDTVAAIEELFPGTLVAARRREDGNGDDGNDDDETLDRAPSEEGEAAGDGAAAPPAGAREADADDVT